MRFLMPNRAGVLVIGVFLSVLTYILLSGLPAEQRIMGSIFLLTVFYWITEPVPLFVTSMITAFSSAVLLGPLAGLFGASPLDYTIFMSPFASPVVVLLFGGFIMARVFSKNNLDIEFCQILLARLGSKPNVVLLGIMMITAVMSMWMSNTATTAIMVATVIPIMRSMPPGTNLSRALLLAIPFSANIGGIATPIGTPPNAIAIGLLAESGIHITFLAWMLAGFPVMIVSLLIAYLLLRIFFPTKRQHFSIRIDEQPRVANRSLVYVTFSVTVVLWVTDWLHGIPASLIALVPVVVFSVTGLLTKRNIREISWDILILIGGGLAMGIGIRQTGLAETVIEAVLPGGLSPMVTLLLLSAVVAILATVMSHTAASNIILPLALSVGAAFPANTVIPVALCASFGMALPISTPPNAIAYGSEMINPKDMLRIGAIITIIGVAITIAFDSLLIALLPGFFPAAG